MNENSIFQEEEPLLHKNHEDDSLETTAKMKKDIFKYELDVSNMNQFNTFYLKDIESKLQGTTLFKFNIQMESVKYVNNILKDKLKGFPFIKLYLGEILIEIISIYLCKCIDDKSFNDYEGIGQCKCSSISYTKEYKNINNEYKNIKEDYKNINKEIQGDGPDKFIEIDLHEIIQQISDDKENVCLKLRLDYIMGGIKNIKYKQINKFDKLKKRLKINNKDNLIHYELIFQNINYRNAFTPHFRVPSFIILKYILPEYLSVISSLNHITSLNYTDTHKIFVYASVCLINNKKYNTSIGKLSFIIGMFKKYSLQLDSINYNSKMSSNKVKQISVFKNIQDSERNSGSNFYLIVPEFLTKNSLNLKIDFIKTYSFMINELLNDVSSSIKYLENFLGIEYFSIASISIKGKSINIKNDLSLLFTVSEIEISNSIGLAMISFSNVILERDHIGLINFKKQILQILVNQLIPISYHSFEYHTYGKNIFKGPLLLKHDFILKELFNSNMSNDKIKNLYKLNKILKYINQFINYTNSLSEIWLQKGLNKFLYGKLNQLFFGKSFLEARKQEFINILESFDKTSLPLINLVIDLETFLNTFLLLNQSLEVFKLPFTKVIKSFKNKYLNIFNFKGDILDSKKFNFYNLCTKNKNYRFYESYNEKVPSVKCELIFHCLETSSGLIVFKEALKSMFSNLKNEGNILRTSNFFQCLSNETMTDYSTFKEFYLRKSGIVSINLFLKIDQKKSQINVFTEHLTNLSPHLSNSYPDSTNSSPNLLDNLNENMVNKRYYGHIPIESREVENNHSYIIESLNDYRTIHNWNSFTSMYHHSSALNRNCKINTAEPDLKFTYYARSKKAKITEGLSFLYIQPDSNYEVIGKIRVLSAYALKERMEDKNMRTQLDAIETIERLLLESLCGTSIHTNSIQEKYSGAFNDLNDLNNLNDLRDINNLKDLNDLRDINNLKDLNDLRELEDIKELEESISKEYSENNEEYSEENNEENNEENTKELSKEDYYSSENNSSSFEDINLINEKEIEISKNKRREFRKQFLNKQITSDYIYNSETSQNLDILLSALFDELTNIYVKYKIIDILALYDYQKVITFYIKYYCIINSTIIKPIYELNREDIFLLEYILDRLSFVFKYNSLYENNIFKNIVNINNIFSEEYLIKKSMVLIDIYISILKYIDSTNSSADYLISKCINGIYAHESVLLFYKPKNINYIMHEIRSVLENIFLYEFINQSLKNSIFVSSLNFILYKYLRGEINLNIDYLINLTKPNNYITIRKVAFDGILLICRKENINNKCREYLKYILLNNKEKSVLRHILRRIKSLIGFNKFRFFTGVSDFPFKFNWDWELNDIWKSIEYLLINNKNLDNSLLINDINNNSLNNSLDKGLGLNNSLLVKEKIKGTGLKRNLLTQNSDNFVVNLKVKSLFEEKQKLPLNLTKEFYHKLYKPLKYESYEDTPLKSSKSSIRNTPLIKSSSFKRFNLKHSEKSDEESLFSEGTEEFSNDEPKKKKLRFSDTLFYDDDSATESLDLKSLNKKESLKNSKSLNGKSIIFIDMFNYKNLHKVHKLFDFKIKIKKIIHMSEIGVICLKRGND